MMAQHILWGLHSFVVGFVGFVGYGFSRLHDFFYYFGRKKPHDFSCMRSLTWTAPCEFAVMLSI
jgi:hypothetical protein